MSDTPLLTVEGVTKRYPGVTANDDVTFSVEEGTIHCLLGENGAGKSSLASIIYGIQKPDEGTINFKGDPLVFGSPSDAIRAGIGMVHQHFELVDPMSVVENVLIGTSEKRLLDLRDVRDKLTKLCENYEVTLDLDSSVGSLSVGEQQWVEILKAMYLEVDLLILDEPTAVLTPDGSSRLFKTLRRLASEGLTIILITHKLSEVMENSDRVTVLRRGRVVDTVDTNSVDETLLTKMMVGREVLLRIENLRHSPKHRVLEISQLEVEAESRRASLRGVDLHIGDHEILGIAGVSGNGQNALFDAIVGLHQPDGGRITVDGIETTNLRPRQVAANGTAGAPADRIQQGLMMDFRVSENLVLGRHRSRKFSRYGVLRKRAISEFAQHSIDQFDIQTPSQNHVTRTLSGGNLQKVVMARELAGSPKVIVVHQPTRGLDVAATEYVRTRLLDERDRGAAIMLISEDLDELFDLSDRIAVLHEGRIAEIFDRADATREKVGRLMAGAGESAESLAVEDD
jgi:ABC-type uncharacterized transport system ATPase subunit